MKKDAIVCVEWEDAYTESRYLRVDINEYDTCICQTVGHLVKNGKDRVIVSGHKWDDGDHKHIHIIPRRSVIRITELRGV